MAAHVREWAGSRLSLFVVERCASPTVTVVEVPPNFNLPGLYSGLENEGVLIAGGYGKLRENTFRIGHMGDWAVADVMELTDIIDQELEDLR
jgi:aspartate aminotransferase-like enzyme